MSFVTLNFITFPIAELCKHLSQVWPEMTENKNILTILQTVFNMQYMSKWQQPNDTKKQERKIKVNIGILL